MQGVGGAGKSTLANKIMAYARSQGLIAVGCASTGLAATIYDDFSTAHSLFCYPVVEDDEKDESEPATCQFELNPERLELMNAATVVVWDEMPSNHKELFEAAYRALNQFRGKVVIAMGDFRQILPVVKNANRVEIFDACISSSYLWSKFEILSLTINMRLEAMKTEIAKNRQQLQLSLHRDNDTENAIEELTQQLANQTKYGAMILAVGEGRLDNNDTYVLNDDESTGKVVYTLRDAVPHYVENSESFEEIFSFLYPRGFSLEHIIKSAVLAATNEKVDEWNARIQKLNPKPMHTLLSKDVFNEVDDPNGILSSMIAANVLEDYNVNGVPPHALTLKVGDVCLVMRNLSKRYGLASNARVVVLNITQYCIQVQTLGEKKHRVTIPRMRFKFRIPGGHSFEITRTQFPLRLAYSMTYNKAQGQTIEMVLLDTTAAPFAHGHLYVALSRVTNYANIRIYCQADDVIGEYAIITNIVYPEILLPI